MLRHIEEKIEQKEKEKKIMTIAAIGIYRPNQGIRKYDNVKKVP